MTNLELLLSFLQATVPEAEPGGGVALPLTIGDQRPEPEGLPMISKDFVIGDGPIRFTVRPTHRGRPATLDGPVTVEVADPGLFSATVLPDGLTVEFEAEGPVGATTATITGDTRQGPEVVTKTTVVGLNAIEGEADTEELPGDFGDQAAAEPSATPAPPAPPTGTAPGTPPETP